MEKYSVENKLIKNTKYDIWSYLYKSVKHEKYLVSK